MSTDSLAPAFKDPHLKGEESTPSSQPRIEPVPWITVELFTECEELRKQCDAFFLKVRNNPFPDVRWASIGITEIQLGFMALKKGIVSSGGDPK